MQTKKITNNATTLSGFTVLMKFLSETDFANSVLDFTTTKIETTRNEGNFCWPLTLLYPVFDKSREPETLFHYNCLWRVTQAAFSDLVAEAKSPLNYCRRIAATRCSRAFYGQILLPRQVRSLLSCTYQSGCASDN